MKRILLLFALCLSAVITASAQGYNQEQTALANFFTRRYKANPFTGVSIVSDYKNYYLLSVVLVKKQPQSIMDRLAQVKSMRDVSQYISNNTLVSSHSVMHLTDDGKGQQTADMPEETITVSSVGFTEGMAILTAFDTNDNQRCYMYYKKIDDKDVAKKGKR